MLRNALMWKKAPLRDKKDTLNVVTPLQHSGLKSCSKNDIFHFPCNHDEIVLSYLILHPGLDFEDQSIEQVQS